MRNKFSQLILINFILNKLNEQKVKHLKKDNLKDAREPPKGSDRYCAIYSHCCLRLNADIFPLNIDSLTALRCL